ncbi:hypothetical protein SGLAM104S_01602 [Streptomyces glaucescens]
MNAADELTAAATEMRRWPGRAAEPLAALMDAAAELATGYPDLARDHDRETCDDYACDLMGRAITAARAINGSAP